MKVLFVCQSNVGRSQVAHGFFQSMSKHESLTAGTEVEQIMAEYLLLPGWSKTTPVIGTPSHI